MAKTYGYARVSTREQNLDRQFDALEGFGVERCRIFADKASGKDFQRPAYCRLLRRLRPGDVLVVGSIDRLGRNYDEVLAQWRHLTKELECAVVVLDMPLLDTRSADGDLTSSLISDIVLQLLSYVAQVERENIKARQEQGIRAARSRGVQFGRPCMSRPEGYEAARDSYLGGHATRRQASGRLGVSINTFVKWLREDEAASVPAKTRGLAEEAACGL